MNELARLIDELEDCCVCGKPCAEADNDGNTIHEACRVERDAALADRLHDRDR